MPKGVKGTRVVKSRKTVDVRDVFTLQNLHATGELRIPEYAYDIVGGDTAYSSDREQAERLFRLGFASAVGELWRMVTNNGTNGTYVRTVLDKEATAALNIRNALPGTEVIVIDGKKVRTYPDRARWTIEIPEETPDDEPEMVEDDVIDPFA